MAKRRTFVEAMNETRALQARRDVMGARVDRAVLEALAPTDPTVAISSYRNALRNLCTRAEGMVAAGGPLLELELLQLAGTVDRFAAAAYKRASEHARVEAGRILRVKIPSNPADILREQFEMRQSALLKRALERQILRLRAVAARGETLTELKQLRASVNRIAYNELTQVAYTELGRWSEEAGSLGGYVVVHRDEKLRATHAAIEGQFFFWTSPPAQHSEVGCRCRLVPAEIALG